MHYSFQAKLLTALLAAVGVVLTTALIIIQQQTAAQVRLVTQQVTRQSRSAFEQLEQVQRAQLAQLGSAFTESPRTRAALEAALDSNDVAWLAETVHYELALRMLSGTVAAFTTPMGEPVATFVDGESVAPDAAGVQPLARQLLDQGVAELLAYRIIGDRLFLLQVRTVDLADHPVGTVTFGLPVDDATAQRLAAVVGAEICFVAGPRCLAGTPRAKNALASLMVARARQGGSGLVTHDGRWLLIADQMSASPSSGGVRVMAVPMDAALEPFDRIFRALVFAGMGALVVAGVLAVILSRGLSRPVQQLVAATQRVGRGDYETHVPVSSSDELGTLAKAFNDMVAGLRLKELYRGVLDKVVSRAVAEDLLKGEIKLGGENREITTVFADVSGFTPLVEGMEPQQVIALLNECMTRLEEAVHAEGGIVDKFIGDEIMAVFGAPIARPEDAQHAIRAALRMQDAMCELNADRGARGERPIAISIGVHTGVAVAGNLGSPNRMNYTVLGEAVNLASRMCKSAGPGEILVSASTWARVQDALEPDIDATPVGAREFRGFSRPIDVVSVQRRTARASGGSAVVAGALLLAMVLSPIAQPAAAQETEGGLPTLAGLGLRYSSPSGTVQLALSGRLDLEGYFPEGAPAWLIPETSPFAAGRARLFADLFLGDHVYALAELRADRGAAPQDGSIEARLEQIFVRFRPVQAVGLQVGKFAHPLGGYAARHLTEADPFIRPPLPYDYRTLVAPRVAPGSQAGFLDWLENAHERRPRGAPVIWDVPYPWGALITAGARDFSARAALVSTAPSGGPDDWNLRERRLRNPTLVLGLGYQIVPELFVGVSASRGPYLEPLVQGTLPLGAELSDFVQEIGGVEIAFARGRVALRGEAFFNRWEVPNLNEDPRDVSYYVEGSIRPVTGWFIAARYGEIRFNHMRDSAPAGEQRWDANHGRVQIGTGYRIVHNAELRAEYMFNNTNVPFDPHDNLLALQFWWAF